MLALDERPPTRFQVRVLRIVRACGPCPAARLTALFHAPPPAVRLAVHILQRGGWLVRRGGALDVTPAGRLFLADPPHEDAA